MQEDVFQRALRYLYERGLEHIGGIKAEVVITKKEEGEKENDKDPV